MRGSRENGFNRGNGPQPLSTLVTREQLRQYGGITDENFFASVLAQFISERRQDQRFSSFESRQNIPKGIDCVKELYKLFLTQQENGTEKPRQNAYDLMIGYIKQFIDNNRDALAIGQAGIVKLEPQELEMLIRSQLSTPRGTNTPRVSRRDLLKSIGGLAVVTGLVGAASRLKAEVSKNAPSFKNLGNHWNPQSSMSQTIEDIKLNPNLLEDYGFSMEMCNQLNEYLYGEADNDDGFAKKIIEAKFASLFMETRASVPDNSGGVSMEDEHIHCDVGVVNSALDAVITYSYKDLNGVNHDEIYPICIDDDKEPILEAAVEALRLSENNNREAALNYALEVAVSDLGCTIDLSNWKFKLSSEDPRCFIVVDGKPYDIHDNNGYPTRFTQTDRDSGPWAEH